jgi:hypothetical protein
LQDIELAVQTEIPLVKQHLSDQVWAQKGKGVTAVRHNRLAQTQSPLSLHPSRADTIAHGFATISRFFPGVREELAVIDEEIRNCARGIWTGAAGQDPLLRGSIHLLRRPALRTHGRA